MDQRWEAEMVLLDREQDLLFPAVMKGDPEAARLFGLVLERQMLLLDLADRGEHDPCSTVAA